MLSIFWKYIYFWNPNTTMLHFFLLLSTTRSVRLVSGRLTKRITGASSRVLLLQKCIAPFLQTVITIPWILDVRSNCILQPLPEVLFVLLQKQELSENHISFVKTLVSQFLSHNFPDSCELCDGFLTHRLRDEISVLLWCWTHSGTWEARQK